MYRSVVMIELDMMSVFICIIFYRLLGQLKYRIDHDFITQINQKQNLWKATTYKEMEDMTLEDLVRRAGGRKSKIIGYKFNLSNF